jgi:hypothetical protein
MRQVFAFMFLIVWAGVSAAVEPDEILSDPIWKIEPD